MKNGNLLAEFQQKPLHNTWMRLKNESHNLVSNRLWTQQGKEKVGQTETVALKHIHYHMYNS